MTLLPSRIQGLSLLLPQQWLLSARSPCRLSGCRSASHHGIISALVSREGESGTGEVGLSLVTWSSIMEPSLRHLPILSCSISLSHLAAKQTEVTQLKESLLRNKPLDRVSRGPDTDEGEQWEATALHAG